MSRQRFAKTSCSFSLFVRDFCDFHAFWLRFNHHILCLPAAPQHGWLSAAPVPHAPPARAAGRRLSKCRSQSVPPLHLVRPKGGHQPGLPGSRDAAAQAHAAQPQHPATRLGQQPSRGAPPGRGVSSPHCTGFTQSARCTRWCKNTLRVVDLFSLCRNFL